MWRAGSLVVVLFLVSMGSFLLTSLLPGDPAVAILGPAATPQSLAVVRHSLALDRPIPTQYATWIGRAATGNLGRSYQLEEQVTTVLARTLVVTVELVILAELLALLIGVPVGVWAAQRANQRFDKIASAVSFGALALPQFALAIALVLVFGVRLHWFPTIGFVHISDGLGANLRSMALPTFTLGIPLAAFYTRVVRTDMVVTLRQPHIELARAMGYPTRRILVRHALRQSSLTLITVAGLQIGALLGGSLIVESIFALPGMGRLMIQRIGARDYTVVQGGVLVIATTYVLANFGADLLHSVLDPRLRHDPVSR